jgi:hypothetical protein
MHFHKRNYGLQWLFAKLPTKKTGLKISGVTECIKRNLTMHAGELMQSLQQG